MSPRLMRVRRIASRDPARRDGRKPRFPRVRFEWYERRAQHIPRRVAGEIGLQGLERGEQRVVIEHGDEALEDGQIGPMACVPSVVEQAADQPWLEVGDAADRACAAGLERSGE